NMTGGDITLENGEVPQDTEEVMSLEGNASPDPYPNMTGGDVTLENGGGPAHVDNRDMQELGFPWGLTSDAPHQMSNLRRNDQSHTPESGTTPPSRTPEAPQTGGPNLPEGQNNFQVLTEAKTRIAI